MRDLIPPVDLQRSLAPFRDPNFKLVVLAELIETRVLDLGDHVSFLKFVEGEAYDPESDGVLPSAGAYDYLGRYPLKARHLSRLRFLEMDPGLAIYDYVFPQWNGKSGLFDIHNLDDLRHLPNLQRLNIAAMLATNDLKPLRTATRLERVSLGRLGRWQNLDALLGLPRLTHLTLYRSGLKARFRDPVLTALKDKGVKINLLRAPRS